MSDQADETETSVFASAKPVSHADLVDGETVAETKTETPETETKAKKSDKRPVAPGVPVWHLSLALGLTVALVGGVLLWMQSPVLAIAVIGGLAILVGLGFIIRHLGGETRRARRAQRSQNATGGNNTPNGSPTNAVSRRNRRNAQERDQSQPRSRRRSQSQQPETSKRDRKRGAETGQRDRSQSRSQSPGPKGTAPKRDQKPRSIKDRQSSGTPPRNNSTQPAGGRDRHNALGGSSGAPNGPRPPRKIYDAGPVCGPGVTPIKPASAKDPEPKAEPVKPTTPASTKPDTTKPASTGTVPTPRTSPENTATPAKAAPAKATPAAEPHWPNVDLDHYPPVTAGNLPRITIPRKAVKLGPIYHRRGEPQWPTSDLDAPTSRHGRSSTMATPDMLTRAERTQHFANAATTALKLADDKTTQAHEFVALAGELDGVEGMERVREEHLQNAAKTAHDAQVRHHMAGIYAHFSQN